MGNIIPYISCLDLVVGANLSDNLLDYLCLRSSISLERAQWDPSYAEYTLIVLAMTCFGFLSICLPSSEGVIFQLE